MIQKTVAWIDKETPGIRIVKGEYPSGKALVFPKKYAGIANGIAEWNPR
jgi:hypothetical protein